MHDLQKILASVNVELAKAGQVATLITFEDHQVVRVAPINIDSPTAFLIMVLSTEMQNEEFLVYRVRNYLTDTFNIADDVQLMVPGTISIHKLVEGLVHAARSTAKQFGMPSPTNTIH